MIRAMRKFIPHPSALIPLLFLASPAFAAERPLREVLYAMPKGGDLHNHLSGTVYAETYLEFAKRDGLCVDTQRLAVVECPATTVDTIVPAARTATDSNLYSTMLDALSMRQFRATSES